MEPPRTCVHKTTTQQNQRWLSSSVHCVNMRMMMMVMMMMMMMMMRAESRAVLSSHCGAHERGGVGYLSIADQFYVHLPCASPQIVFLCILLKENTCMQFIGNLNLW